ncbi:MAG: hypothetical protein SCALA702_01440 [Melioribacteraceae bacterium]|nr:MAG: hypothetical protein SCALA702_01440 [Melioribacteraceae bacterium]
MDLFSKLKDYLNRAQKLLDLSDEVSLTYCALELRKAIELMVWTQFKDVFKTEITNVGLGEFFNPPLKLQNQSISKMYDFLKKHIHNYSNRAANKTVITHKSGFDSDESMTIDGSTCFIQPELVKSDYKYLSEILHYEKEVDPAKFQPSKEKLSQIYNRLKFIEDNYTFRRIVPNKNMEVLIENFTKTFD